MVKLTPHLICGLIGKMYVDLSMQTDKSISYMNGYMDTIYHYESALKAMMIFNPTLKEVPVHRKLLSLKVQTYDKRDPLKSKDYNQGSIDANNFLYYHVQNCYLGK